MSSDELANAVKEILPFLDVLTPTDYKLKILEYMLGTTATSDGVILSRNEKLIDSLLDLTCHDKDDNVRNECLKYLVNITSVNPDKNTIKKMMKDYFIEYLLQIGLLKEKPYTETVFMLLTNLSLEPENAEFVFKCFTEAENLEIETFIKEFCTDGQKETPKMNYLTSMFANLSIIIDVRLKFLQEECYLLKKILPFVNYEKSLVRRTGICSIIRNCLFETEYHEKLLMDEMDSILPHLLLPLAGPEEFSAEENDELPLDLQYLPPDKDREKSNDVLLLLIESLFQLCATKNCRLKLKESGVYYILREFHKQLEDDSPLELQLENLIQVLIGDEPTIGDGNLRKVEIPEHVQKKFDEVDNAN